MRIVYIILLMVIVFFAGFLIRTSFTGRVVQETDDYSYTRAICNSDNECMDVLVSCENGDVASIVPNSRVVRQFEGWQDPRNLSEKFC